jgi:endonuclease III
MKQSSLHAKRVKQLQQKMARQFGKPGRTEPTEPLQQLIEGILSVCASPARARAGMKRLAGPMVDLHELRVTPPMELTGLIGDTIPFAAEKAQRIVDALNAIRVRQDTLELGFLKQRTRREAREYLESLDGVDRAAAARVMLFSLGGHAIPVDALTLYVLQKDGMVDAGADAVDTQAFLERVISAADAPAFAELLDKHVAAKAARLPEGKLEELYVRRPRKAPPPGAVRIEHPPRAAKVAVPTKAAASPKGAASGKGASESKPAKAEAAQKKQSAASKNGKRDSGPGSPAQRPSPDQKKKAGPPAVAKAHKRSGHKQK